MLFGHRFKFFVEKEPKQDDRSDHRQADEQNLRAAQHPNAMSIALFHLEHGAVDMADEVLGDRIEADLMFVGDGPLQRNAFEFGPDVLLPEADQRVHISGNTGVSGDEQRSRRVAVHKTAENDIDLIDLALQPRNELRVLWVACGRMASRAAI